MKNSYFTYNYAQKSNFLPYLINLSKKFTNVPGINQYLKKKLLKIEGMIEKNIEPQIEIFTVNKNEELQSQDFLNNETLNFPTKSKYSSKTEETENPFEKSNKSLLKFKF